MILSHWILVSLFTIAVKVALSIHAKESYLRVRIQTASQAISSFIDILSEEYAMRFQVVSIGLDDRVLVELSNEILAKTNSPVELKRLNQSDTYFVEPEVPQVILAKNQSEVKIEYFYAYVYVEETAQAYVKKFENRSIMNTYRDTACLFYFYESPVESRNSILSGVHYNSRVYNLIHSSESNSVLLFKFEFNLDSCQMGFFAVNEFWLVKKHWNSTKFIYDYNNFNECPVEFHVNILKHDYDLIVSKNEKTSQLGGYLGEIVNTFASKYKVKWTQESGIFELLITPFSLESYPSFSIFHLTFPLINMNYVFMITRGPYYTSYEKMILPFDKWTWILIAVSIFIGFATILTVYCLSRNIQHFIFGAENRIPSLCLTEIFFGVGLVRVPSQSFARFLFMMFTLFCLVMRTAYQGKMFEFMTSEMRKEPIAKSNDELFAKKVDILNPNVIKFILNG